MPIILGLGDRLREARRKSGLSLEELAKRVGSNRRSLYSYEKGLVDPRTGDLLEIAKVLQVKVAFLIGENHVSLDPDLERRIRKVVNDEIDQRSQTKDPSSSGN